MIVNSPQWYEKLEDTQPPAHMHNWLAKPYIISKAMKECCKKLDVSLLYQQQAVPFEDEIKALDLDDRIPLVRKVYLNGDGRPWSFGRVIVPEQTYLTYQSAFDELGGKLIGESLLYGNPKTTRGPFSYIRLEQHHPFHQDMLSLLKQHYADFPQEKCQTLWGRRSIFNIDGYPLMVQEAYFPWIPEYPREEHDRRNQLLSSH